MEYRMVNPETGNAEDISCTVADMEVLKQEGWVMVFTPNPNSIISGRDHSGHGGGHGWRPLDARCGARLKRGRLRLPAR